MIPYVVYLTIVQTFYDPRPKNSIRPHPPYVTVQNKKSQLSFESFDCSIPIYKAQRELYIIRNNADPCYVKIKTTFDSIT